MKKIIHIIIKVVFTLLLISPILGTFGIFPAPTAEMYTNLQAFAFIQALMDAQYLMIMMAVVHILAIIAIWTRREALAALLELPIALNIVGFHAFLDNGIVSKGAIMGDVLLIIVIYVIWKNRDRYRTLFQR
jgi:glycerol-3-phosphate acyltransferase PlsY